jgi:hypothetical protein
MGPDLPYNPTLIKAIVAHSLMLTIVSINLN